MKKRTNKSIDKSLKWAIIGCGNSGLAHMAQIRNLQNKYSIVASVDPILERAQNISDNCYEKPLELIDMKGNEIDGVSICTPPENHFDLSMLFLNCKIPVFCEKPFFFDNDQIRIIAKSQVLSKTLFDMVRQQRFEGPLVFIKNEILAKSNFNVRKIKINLNLKGVKTCKYIIIHFLPHYIDIANYFAGTICNILNCEASSSKIKLEVKHVNDTKTTIEINSGQKKNNLSLDMITPKESISLLNGKIIHCSDCYTSCADKENIKFNELLNKMPFHSHFGPGLFNQYINFYELVTSRRLSDDIANILNVNHIITEVVNEI
jgi:hypothetical protein